MKSKYTLSILLLILLSVGVAQSATWVAEGDHWIDSTTNATHTVVMWNTSGLSTTWATPTGVTQAEVLVVGGGGSGGADAYGYGGGGGAGGVVEHPAKTITGSISVVVGAGGYTIAGQNGSNSSFSDIVAIGGGGGANISYLSTSSGSDGGSGGGAYKNTSPASSTQGSPSGGAGYGYRGGAGDTGAGGAGGGGGAGAVGVNSTTNQGAAGGDGRSNSITGAAVTYAGGGGGVGYYDATANNGGTGGGGNGGHVSPNLAPTSATNATGSGGGGGHLSNTPTWGKGGSGIVIIKYQNPTYSGVVFGDSIARGNGNSRLDPVKNLTYPDQIGTYGYELEHNWTPAIAWYNNAIGGQTTTELLARWPRDVLALTYDPGDGNGDSTLTQKPNIAILDVGTAALLLSESQTTMKNNMYTMAQNATTNGIKVIFVGIAPTSGVSNATTVAFNSWMESNLTAVGDVRFYDAYTTLTDGSGALQVKYDFGDGVHWNTQAYIDVTADLFNENQDLFNLSSTPPIVSFTSNVTSGFGSLPVQFNDTSVTSPIGWNWSFTNVTPGNNTQVWWSTTQNATNTFGVGTWNINLNVTNATGFNVSTVKYWVNVTPHSLTSNFTANETGAVIGGNILFMDNSTGSVSAWTRNWSFGDGTYSTDQDPIHSYSANGVYSVNLTIYNSTIGYSSLNRTGYITISESGAFSGFTQQDIMIDEIYFLNLTFKDIVTLVNIPIVTVTDNYGNSVVTTDGTASFQCNYSTRVVSASSTGYYNETESYVVYQNASDTIYLTTSPTVANSSSSTVTYYTPWQVRIRILDWYGVPLEGTTVTANYVASTLPSTDTSWLVSAFGINTTTAGEMVNGSIAMAGTTDSNGGLSFTMFKSIQYALAITNATAGISSSKTLYPTDQEYVIRVTTASQVAGTNTLEAMQNTSLPVYQLNSTAYNLSAIYHDTTGRTSDVWFYVKWRNGTIIHSYDMGNPGTSAISYNYTIINPGIGTEVIWMYNATRSGL